MMEQIIKGDRRKYGWEISRSRDNIITCPSHPESLMQLVEMGPNLLFSPGLSSLHYSLVLGGPYSFSNLPSYLSCLFPFSSWDLTFTDFLGCSYSAVLMRSLFSFGFISVHFMAHPELLSSLSEEEIRMCKMLPNPSSCVFKEPQHWLLSIVCAFTKILFLKKTIKHMLIIILIKPPLSK